MSEEKCEHGFQFLRNESYWMEYGYRGNRFVSVDYFYCSKCLEYREVKKEHTTNQGNFEQRPDWCKSITKQVYD